MLQARLKRLMEQNLRLNATNKMLQKSNKGLLDQAIVSYKLNSKSELIKLQSAENKFKGQKEIVAKAAYSKDFGEMQIDLRRQYLQKLDDRDLSQEKNLKDLVLHAKKITAELEKYK